MKAILLDIYNIVFNFFATDLAVSQSISKIIAVVAVIVVVCLALKLVIGAIRWIGNLLSF
jgi:hypothetical protein